MAKAPLPTAVLQDESNKAGLPAFRVLFGLPKNKSQWRTGKRTFFRYTAAGPLPLFTGFPIKLSGALYSVNILKKGWPCQFVPPYILVFITIIIF